MWVGGIDKKLREQKQQHNMRRMAQGTQGPPQGIQTAPQAPPQGPPQGATQMAASGGIIMQGAPNLQRMAGGGIIGFDPGKENSEVELPVTDAQLKRMGLTRAIWENELNAEGKRAYLDSFPVEGEDPSIARGMFTDVKDFFNRPFAKERAARAVQGTFGGAKRIGALFAPGSEGRATIADLEAKKAQAEAIRNMSDPSAQALAPVVQPPAPIKGPFGPLDPSNTGTNSLGPRVGTNPNAAPAPLGGPRVGTNPNALSGIAQARVPGLGQQRAAAGIPTANIAGDAFDISATRAGKLIGRDPKAAQRAAMLERYKAANIEAENLRKKTEFADTLAFSGGDGFGRGAVEVANRRSKLASAKDVRLRNELGLETLNMKADSADAGKQITAGESAAKAALENSSRKELNRLTAAATASTSMTGARKNLTNIVKAIADLKQKNLEAVDKALANRVDLLNLRKAAADDEPEAKAKLEKIYKEAEEKASKKTLETLRELEALRKTVQNRINGFGKATLKSKS